VTRRFNLAERYAIALQVQVFHAMNHANYYVQNGTGVNSVQYVAAPFGNNPDGSTTCGDGVTLNQTCYLVPDPTFGKLQVINALNGPRVMKFALKGTFQGLRTFLRRFHVNRPSLLAVRGFSFVNWWKSNQLRRGQFSGNVSPNIGDFGISLRLFCASARLEPS